ncbi:MAG TPA: hypothetical protein PK095_17360 [Myxococcota bacterium]|nr:hypothetical protein [Myxococcota bacterium]
MPTPKPSPHAALRAPVLGLLLLVFGASSVRAEAPADDGLVGFPFRFGIFGGWHFTSSDIDVSGDREPDLVPGAGPHLGLRLGWRVIEGFALELEGGLVLSSVARDDAAVQLLPLHLMAVWRPAEAADLTPVLGVGAGLVAQLPGAGASDVDLLLAAMGGVEVRVAGPLNIRLTGGVHATDGVDATFSWTPVVSLGFDFKTYSDRRSDLEDDPPDDDEDDPGEDELLPVRPTRPIEPIVRPQRPRPTPALTGCPAGIDGARCKDSDDDGRIDAFDRCPSESGDATHEGCPDGDGDGVPDRDDACPRTRGEVGRFGCPGPR